ncbi:MAG TPA: hypothetical protein VNO70_02780 [Blastocatellia bacterium]|nr:hypothetical protein [Blastocatellia bacterium]
MKIAVITTPKKPGDKSTIGQVVELLTARGAAVDMIYPEERLIDLTQIHAAHDLYILKSGTDAALSLAGALHLAGAAILNPYPVVAMMKDKILAAKVLETAAVPQPATYITVDARQLAGLLADGPIVVKPYRGGSQGRGVKIVREAAELDEMQPEQGLLFAQRYHTPDGRDYKLYCIGEQVFGVMRVWPARTYEDKLGEPFTVTPELRELVLRCGQAFGADLFGLDVIFSQGQPYVVDINTFPGFKGVPDAEELLADYIYRKVKS